MMNYEISVEVLADEGLVNKASYHHCFFSAVPRIGDNIYLADFVDQKIEEGRPVIDWYEVVGVEHFPRHKRNQEPRINIQVRAIRLR